MDYPELADEIADVERVYADQVKRRDQSVRSGEVAEETNDETPVYAVRYERYQGAIVEIIKDSDGPPRVIERPDLT